MTAPDQPEAPATQRVNNDVVDHHCRRIRSVLQAGNEPLSEELAWLDLETARARIAELEAEVTRLQRARIGDSEIAGRLMCDRDRLATELAEAKAAGWEEGLREAEQIVGEHAFRWDSYGARLAVKANRARLSAAEPTADTGEKGC